jgi:hypothetical protein
VDIPAKHVLKVLEAYP